MSTPDYSIISPDLDALAASQCRLLIKVNGQFLHYIVIYNNNTIAALKFYQAGGKAVAEWLEEILAGDDLLKREWKEIAVIYAVPENQLVSSALLNDHSAHELSEIVSGDLRKGIVLTSGHDRAEIYTLFQVPAEMHRFFQHNFSSPHITHYYDLWMQEEKKDGVHVVFYPNELLVSVIKNRQQQLIQSYTYQAPEDAAYYLLTLYAQYDFSTEELPLQVSGMIVQESAIYSELLKYFRSIETDAAPATLALVPGFENYPAHFFSPLLKLVVCAL